MTRNGVTELVTKELVLKNGIRVVPGGTIFTPGGEKLTLRPTQILTFDGKLIDTTAKPVTSTTTTTTTTSDAATSKTGEASAEAISAAEAERRRKATQDSDRR